MNTQKHDDDIVALNTKLQLETKKTYDQILQPLQSAISTSVQGMIKGTTTIQQAITNLGDAMLSGIINMCSKSLMTGDMCIKDSQICPFNGYKTIDILTKCG